MSLALLKQDVVRLPLLSRVSKGVLEVFDILVFPLILRKENKLEYFSNCEYLRRCWDTVCITTLQTAIMFCNCYNLFVLHVGRCVMSLRNLVPGGTRG